MNQNPLWKTLLVLLVLVGGALYALPNFYGSDPALQISARRDAMVDQQLVERITDLLKAESIEYRSVELEQEPDSVLVRFNQVDTQLVAQSLVSSELGRAYGVALN
ncbi:MAG: protein translocase subunit SecD, partial [Gammaproteobacteria bacterium]